MSLPTRLAAPVLLVLAATSYGMTFSLNRIATVEGIPFIAYVFWQALGGGSAMLIASLAMRTPPSLKFSHLRLYLALGALGVALPYGILAFVAPKLPASVVALGLTLTPIFTYLFAAVARLERMRILRVLGVLLGLGGVLLVLLPRSGLPSPDMMIWAFLALAAPLCFALGGVVVAIFRPPGSHPVPLTCGAFIASALLLMPVMAGTGDWWIFDAVMSAGDWALIGAAAINALFFVLAFVVIGLAGPVFFSINGYVGTLAGVGWAVLFFNDKPSPWLWAALFLLLSGLLLVNRGANTVERASA